MIVVSPTGNVTPLDGEHDIVIGAVPPEATGGGNMTGIGRPLGDVIDCDAGHATVMPAVGDGPLGLFEQVTAALAQSSRTARRRL
ncbi:MAG TPA: hypothetical protein VKD69_09805 [Vicinamibacterales bacterium]|nr:hypothetical protein [Vicinamibacterales bacterium]